MAHEVAQRNLEHAIANDCVDPDCEIHNPEVIESAPERYTAKAMFLAGALSLVWHMEHLEGELDAENYWEEGMNQLQEKHGLTNNWP